jgi:hypothetical protein
VRFDDRLLFILCKTCALQFPEGCRKNSYQCTHTDSERQFVSTCTHIELNAALDVGYKAVCLFRVMEYSDWDEDLFKGYVREFYKIKLEASGFPDRFNTLELQQQFIDETVKKFVIYINKNNMKSNPAMRTLAKLCLNSL